MVKRNNDSIGACSFIFLVILFSALCCLGVCWCIAQLWNWLVPMFWEAAPMLNAWIVLGWVFLISLVYGIIKNIIKSI